MASGGDYALAVLARSRQVAAVMNFSTSPTVVLLDLPAGPSRIALSPSGDAAAFYYSETALIEVVKGFPGPPSPAWSFVLSGMESGVAALAVSDGGGAVMLAASSLPASIWLASPEAGQRFVHAAGASPSLAFLSGSEDAVIADAATGELWLMRDPKGASRLALIGGAAEGISRPVAILPTPDNSTILVANAEPPGVVGVSLSGSQAFRVDCPSAPTTVVRMARGSAFRLNDPGNGPIWLLETSGPAPRIVFVPDQMTPLRDSRRVAPLSGNGGDR